MQHCARWFIAVALALMAAVAEAERIKDLASVAGVRNNELVGYGLVVGLDGTGDQVTQTQYTVQSLKNMLNQFGITIPPGITPQPKNIAAVSITATISPFLKPGQMIDVTVASIGNAKSLRGGTLLMSPLKGADGQIYAMAQGNLIVGGLSAGGADGSTVTVNVPSVGRIPNGATVERAITNPFLMGDSLVFNLHTADFTTASRLAASINRTIGPDTAQPIDGSSIRVSAPTEASERVAFASVIENILVDPGDVAARVVVNSRTGTVVIGNHVRVKTAAVAHGNLTVTVTEDQQVSQPGPFSRVGTTEVTQRSAVDINEEGARAFLLDPGITLQDIVNAVNRVGAAPSDLVAILEALKQAGALRAELIVL
jgi:flagellar P-ring protein precursor FlgI